MELYCFGVEKAQRKQQREKSADSEQFLFVLFDASVKSFFASSVLCLRCCFPPHVKNPRERSAENNND